MAWVISCLDDGSEHDFDELLVIGRGGDVGISLGNLAVSRKHCAIFESGGNYYLADLGSRNGTIYYSGNFERHMPNVFNTKCFKQFVDKGRDFPVFFSSYLENRTGRELLVVEGNHVQELKELDKIGIAIGKEDKKPLYLFEFHK